MNEREIPICPLLSMGSPNSLQHCKLAQCAWYSKTREECIIRIIARGLSSIAYMIYTIAEK